MSITYLINIGIVLEDITKDGIISKLIPSLPAFLIQLTAFILLIVIVTFLAYKPVKKRLAERKKYQEDKIKEAERNAELSEKKIKEASKIILDYKEQAMKFVEEGKNNAVKQQEEIILQAKKDASTLKAKALKEVQDENEKMKEEIYKETVDLSLAAASKLINKEMDNATNEALAKDFINDLKNSKENK